MLDLTGQKFGRLTAVYEEKRTEYGARRWLCECECGNEKIIHQGALMSGHTRSCGCLRKEELIERSTKHNRCHTRLYNIYAGMKQRCYNENEAAYKNYGGRGIIIGDDWMGDDGFEHFYDWSMSRGYSDDLTIDRIDVNGNYEPDNCRWATSPEQSRNKRTNILLTFNGETKILRDWCKITGIDYSVAKARYHKGWEVERVLFQPVKKLKRVN